MKQLFKMILLGLMAFVSIESQAQDINRIVFSSSTKTTNDSVSVSSAADTLNYYLNTAGTTTNVKFGGSKDVVTILVKLVKISGTVAGDIFIYGGIDGDGVPGSVSWKQIDTDTLTNATNDYWYELQRSDYRYYKIEVRTDSGTMAFYAEPHVLIRD